MGENKERWRNEENVRIYRKGKTVKVTESTNQSGIIWEKELGWIQAG